MGSERISSYLMSQMQLLEKPEVIFVCRPQILAEKPGTIRRHIIHRIELIAEKRRRHEADALLRDLRTYRVHMAEGRHEPVKQATALRRALNSPFFTRVSGWRW